MAKKPQRQPNLPQETLERARREMSLQPPSVPAQREIDAAAAEAVLPRPKAPQPARIVDLHTQYAYVLTDLRNMAVLAGILLLVLVVLSLVI